MIQYLEKEGTRICNQVYAYSKKWKQSINVSKTVPQLFHTQVKRSVVNVTMNGEKTELVKEFKYLGFTCTDRLSLKPAVEKCIGNIQRSMVKLRWLKTGRSMSSKLLRQCFFCLYLSTFTMDISIFSSACSNSTTNITTKIPCRSSAGVSLSVCVCTEPL